MATQKNMSPTKCPMPSLDPNYRNKVFEEVATGYTYEMAIEEARRCLNCKNKPCVGATQTDLTRNGACTEKNSQVLSI